MYRMFTPGRMLHLVSVAGRTLCGRSTDAMVTMPYNVWDRLAAEANGNCLRCERHISDAYAAGWSASADENRADLETEEDRYARNHSATQQAAWDMGWNDYATDETNYGRSTREAWARMTSAESGPKVAPVAPIVVDSTPTGIFAAMMRANANDDTAPQSRLYGLLSDYLRRVLAATYGQDADAVYAAIVSSGEASDDVIDATIRDAEFYRQQAREDAAADAAAREWQRMTHVRLTRVRDGHRMPCLDCGRPTHYRTQSQAFGTAVLDVLRAYDNPICARCAH